MRCTQSRSSTLVALIAEQQVGIIVAVIASRYGR
jgi:hypothetical protein